ncbi:serine hydrolase [Terrimonas sp.]|uniref:serine hydrolase n=1 Tax=Terrimonas sp. TaxID=1914338 RepID=UPI001403CDB9|nr:serine hydrolase [Terrimonas sp.]
MKYLFTILTTAFICHSSPAKPVNDTSALREKISNIFSQFPEATFGVAFKNLNTSATFFWNAEDIFHSASTMKTPVMIEVYKQAAQGKFSVTDSMLVKNTFSSIVDGSTYSLDSTDDSEHDLYLHIGKKLPIRDIVFRMITVSSNLATNNIIELVGAKNVTATMRKLGTKNMQVLRGVEDKKAFEKGLNNITTAYDLVLVMESIAKGTVADKRSTDDMLDILLHQRFKRVIGGKLPADVKVANKTGAFKGVRHDSGIVFLPDGRKYVIVLLSRGIEDDEKSAAALAEVSRLVYEEVTKKPLPASPKER